MSNTPNNTDYIISRISRLWDYFDGEPFLDNPPLMVIGNPKGKKKGKKMAKRRVGRPRKVGRPRRRVAGRKAAPARKRRYTRRRRTTAVARRRTRSRSGSRGVRVFLTNPRKRYRRNPAIMGIALPPLSQVVYAGAGFIGTPMLEGFLSRFVPVSIQANTIGKYAVRIASFLGLSLITKQIFGANEAKMVAIGGAAYTLTSAIGEFAPGILPATSMGAYATAGPTVALGAYAQPNKSLGAPAFGARNTVASAGRGGANIVASRFRRFQ